jgi:hypothetical protein
MGAALTAGEQEPPSRQYAQRAINEVVAHRAFTRYHRDGSPAAIPEADFVDSLRCTLNSSAKVLRARLERLRTQATACHNARVLQYLEACERHFRHLLGPAGTPG